MDNLKFTLFDLFSFLIPGSIVLMAIVIGVDSRVVSN